MPASDADSTVVAGAVPPVDASKDIREKYRLEKEKRVAAGLRVELPELTGVLSHYLDKPTPNPSCGFRSTTRWMW